MHRSPEGYRVVVFAEPDDKHAKAIARRLSSLGCVAAIMRLQDCGFETRVPGGLRIPGGLPTAAVVRTVSEGSFEAVTKRLGFLHALREQGVIVWNDARAVERCVDKSMTSFLLGQAGVPTPESWAVESRAEAADIVATETSRGPLVLKPLFGSQGRGLRLINHARELPEEAAVNSVYYLQRFVEVAGTHYHDYRVFVIAGIPVAAMRRASQSWITNVKQGGKPCAALLDPDLAALSCRAAQAVGADFCGVDLIRGQDGQYHVLEVNSMPAWSGLQQVTSVNIAHELAAALLVALRARVALRTAV